ncbi:MAG: DNA polymerase III subunit delta' [Proteobacteria bacterium]|nr:DNA polymerase III subunit delta' [Pseudomonadota bacterium]
MTFESIVGQERAIRLLTRILENNRLAHALLFTGVDGIGRQTTAKAMAMALNCLKPVGTSACGVCRSCKKVISGNHPDVIIVKPSGTFIKIDQVRSLRKTLRFAPLEGGRRVIIINDAQTMNLEASNAMLKILEEPPNDTYIILTASQTTDLLPTIVSRCQQIPFRPVPVADIAEALGARSELDADAATAVAVLAKGSLGRALSADAEKWMDWRKDLLERVGLVSSESTHALFVFADTLARDKDRLQDALDVIIIWFRDILICRFHPEKILNRDCMEEIQRKSEQLSVDDILEIIMAVFAAQRAIVKNANRRLALEVMMMRMSSAFRKGLHPQGY